MPAHANMSAYLYHTSYIRTHAGITNFTCFLLRVSGVINFRPTYKYWSASLSLIGGILNLGIMFWINTLYASSAFFLLIVLAVYLAYQAPVVGWGDVSQALIYHQVRKYLFRLDQSEAAQVRLPLFCSCVYTPVFMSVFIFMSVLTCMCVYYMWLWNVCCMQTTFHYFTLPAVRMLSYQ